MSQEQPTRMDPEAIKQAIDLLEFAGRYTQLRQISLAGEYAGPCPRCGGEDRFHVKGSRFYCRQCYPRGGDVIDLVRILHSVSFPEACRMLSTDPSLFSERPFNTPTQIQKSRETSSGMTNEQASAFTESARKTVLATNRQLLSTEGGAGRAYLQARGLTEVTWRMFWVGYGTTFHPLRQRNESAIFIPWLSENGRRVEALRHRFTGPHLAKNERYTLKSGSRPVLFGLHTLRQATHLLIVEGEFNCMALVQAGLVALSLGSETGARHHATLARLLTIVPQYRHVAIWFDDSQQGQWLADQLNEAEPFRKEKPRLLTSDALDANELLKRGELTAFLARHHIHSG